MYVMTCYCADGTLHHISEGFRRISHTHSSSEFNHSRKSMPTFDLNIKGSGTSGHHDDQCRRSSAPLLEESDSVSANYLINPRSRRDQRVIEVGQSNPNYSAASACMWHQDPHQHWFVDCRHTNRAAVHRSVTVSLSLIRYHAAWYLIFTTQYCTDYH